MLKISIALQEESKNGNIKGNVAALLTEEEQIATKRRPESNRLKLEGGEVETSG